MTADRLECGEGGLLTVAHVGVVGSNSGEDTYVLFYYVLFC